MKERVSHEWAVALIAVGIAAAGCASDYGASSTTSSTVPSSVAGATPAPLSALTPPRVDDYPPGLSPSIANYILQDGVVVTPVSRFDRVALDLPYPTGWEDAGATTPTDAYGAIRYYGPGSDQHPATIVLHFLKLNGNVVPQKLIDLLPGPLINLPGYVPRENGKHIDIGGFPGYEVGGTWTDGDLRKFASRTAVLVSAGTDLYLLHFTADAIESQTQAVTAALDVITRRTTITIAR